MNLLCSEEPGSDAALHFNPRLDESTVVFNTLERGTWGAEERGSGIPFQRGQPFDVLLIATEEGFKVCLFHRAGSNTHISSLPRPGRPLAEVGIKGVAKVGRASPVPHLLWRKRTTVRGQACVGSKDEIVRAKCSKGGSPARRCGHPLSCSLSTGV